MIDVKHSVLNLETCKKLAALIRDHRPAQVWNTLHFGYHAIRRFPALQLPYQPLWLVLFITARCNLRCLQCPYGSPDSPREPRLFQDMTVDFFLQVLNHFASSTSVGLTGGEPLLHPQLFEMIHLAHERCMKVHIPTNGTLLAYKVGNLLEAPVEFLNVSFYGADAEDFARATGAQSSLYDDMLRGVSEILKHRRPHGYPRVLRASFICTKKNMHRAIDFIRLCEGLGVDQIKLKNLNYFDIPGYEASLCLHEDDQEVQEFIGRLRNQSFRVPVFLPRLYRRRYGTRGCTMPFRLLSIDGDGFIGPCCVRGTGRRWDNFLSAGEAWNGPTMTTARRNLIDQAYPLPPGCLHCEEMILERPSVGGEG